MTVQTVHVPLDDRAYDIHIGPGVLGDVAQYVQPFLNRPRVVIVVDAHVAGLHLATVTDSLDRAGVDYAVLQVPQGEASKSWDQVTRIVEWMLDQNVERRDLVLAMGGGVVGDLVGFAAAILRRGVRFVQLPTSLLAQVDSSVGGKTGINTRHGKNLVGAFHQPTLVLADTAVLGTLTPRDFLAGYGEVVKYGLLGNAEFFDWLEINGPKLAEGDMDARAESVRISCQMKADIVVRDETEQGDRALLNLGHTFCHALEAATGYSDRLLHGEGVAIGCALAFEVSARMGLCSQEAPSRVRAHLQDMGMMRDLADIDGDLPDADALIGLMGQDKKVLNGQIRFIMARAIGEAFVTSEVDLGVVRDVLVEGLAE